MALVRISSELRQDVRHSINQIYNPKVQAAHHSSNSQWGRTVYDLMMAPYKDSLSTVQSQFIYTTDRIALLGITGVVEFPVPLAYALPSNSPWPNRDREKLFPLISGQDYHGIMLKDDHVALGPIRQEMIDFVDRINKATQEKDVVVKTLDALLDAHTTLASALQAWPALWELLPQSTKERHAALGTKAKITFAQPPDLSHLDNLAADFARKKLLAAGEKK